MFAHAGSCSFWSTRRFEQLLASFCVSAVLELSVPNGGSVRDRDRDVHSGEHSRSKKARKVNLRHTILIKTLIGTNQVCRYPEATTTSSNASTTTVPSTG
mmetsp:Transcript_18406/g.31992  ORF Transcript_18406/g.31992 Transcript_18406/m.31992 type:complete len:100 (+) Transcript_18406:44-343(+)